MPPLNWDVFASLPGSAEINFEMLCRAIIRKTYGQYGSFAARAAQPGVEFHLKLDRNCSLGDAGRWYGWQSRWYDLPSGRAIGTTRRNKIKDAIATTQRELPELTDWVLWTRHPLTAGDQKWFYGLSKTLKLHLWTAAEVDEHLVGEAEILRSTYFGELILTPDALATRHTESVAPIRKRWTPEVHQSVRAERDVRAMLGETGSWNDLPQTAESLRTTAKELLGQLDLPDGFATAVTDLAQRAESTARFLDSVNTAIANGDLDHLRDTLSGRPSPPDGAILTLPRRLRATRHFSGLLATNVVALLRNARTLFDRVERAFGVSLTSLVADAGYGKTQLSAQLTARMDGRPAGILLFGRDLHSNHTLDDLARRVVVNGKAIATMDALLAALDAAGQRARRRLPILIDGLNESEDPRAWKPLLATLAESLKKFPYVLVVCTVRSAFAEEALPDDLLQLEIKDFGEDFIQAIRGYFKHYKIDPSDADVPFEILRHPLKLRLYCEVTNPTRSKTVSIEFAPGSLTGLFDLYVQQASERIAELSPHIRRYYQQDVRTALDQIGAHLWDHHTRTIEMVALRRLLGDEQRPWDQSLVRALEQEGILIRLPGDGGSSDMAPVFDALGGHLLADAILARNGQTGIVTWLQDVETRTAFAGGFHVRHPLASDTFAALVGLFPKRLHRQQVWQFLDDPLRGQALRLAADLEAAYLDALTVEQLVPIIKLAPLEHRDIFERLRQTRASSAHPLNSHFLDRVLRSWSVADRDLRWSEWMRKAHGIGDVRRLADRWKSGRRTAADPLWARWLMWMLTSTVRELRDEATRALYWFGRMSPIDLFDLTLESLTINDYYVPERMLAASYGVSMANQQLSPDFAAAFGPYLHGLSSRLFGADATAPTNHWLARLYVRGTLDFARVHCAELLPQPTPSAFAPGPEIEPLQPDDDRSDEVSHTLHMDFANYTVGSLFEDRANYDNEHAGHKAALSHVRGVVRALGWNEASFGRIEEDIASSAWSARNDRAPAERYGKKYGWIGFHAYAGVRENVTSNAIDREQLSEVDIDPSFPDRPSPDDGMVLPWVSPELASDEEWITSASTASLPEEFFYRQKIGLHDGPWVAVHSSLQLTDKLLGRTAFGILSAVAVDRTRVQTLTTVLLNTSRPGGRLTDVPTDHYTFAGEIPWSSAFAPESVSRDAEPQYRFKASVRSEKPFVLEILAHRYGWESYHSDVNDAGTMLVPSKAFSRRQALRGLPQTFDQMEADGRKASISLAAPAGMKGEILFLREDLLARYLAGRTIVWFAFGERRLYGAPDSPPDWYSDHIRQGTNAWRVVRDASEVAPGIIASKRNAARKTKASRPGQSQRK